MVYLDYFLLFLMLYSDFCLDRSNLLYCQMNLFNLANVDQLLFES